MMELRIRHNKDSGIFKVQRSFFIFFWRDATDENFETQVAAEVYCHHLIYDRHINKTSAWETVIYYGSHET